LISFALQRIHKSPFVNSVALWHNLKGLEHTLPGLLDESDRRTRWRAKKIRVANCVTRAVSYGYEFRQ
jgi:hypothetical protein